MRENFFSNHDEIIYKGVENKEASLIQYSWIKELKRVEIWE